MADQEPVDELERAEDQEAAKRRARELEEDDDIADELYIASVIDSLWT